MQTAVQATAVDFWQRASNENLRPSGSQIYAQRLNALLQGQIQTNLKESASVRLWTTASPQPTYQQWQQLLRQEAYLVSKQARQAPLGILLGDSLSMWFPNELLPTNQIWLNQAISGENTGQILARLGHLDYLQPDTIYLMAGVNDLKQGISETTVLNNLRSIIRHLRCSHPNTVIVVQSLLPTNYPYLSGERANRINQQLKAIAAAEGANYLNLYPLFADGKGVLRQELSTDGLHLSRAGYAIWQSVLQGLEDCLN
jgi:lysophospholipase L1-like esterase